MSYEPMAEQPDELPREEAVYRHLRSEHTGFKGLPPAAWTMADKMAGCPHSRSSEEFLEWLTGPSGDGYIKALHDAAHTLGDPGHEAHEV